MGLTTPEVIEAINTCTQCQQCQSICPAYKVTVNELFSPVQRLDTALHLLEGESIKDQQIESIYNCPKCMQCETVCPMNIPITKIIHHSRQVLAERKLGPLEPHRKVINDILEKGNSVSGDQKKRLDWLPEEFNHHQSETLLYLGCLPSYVVQDVATSSYLVLKKLEFDFMILEDEGCCGTYLYESGRVDLAGEFFQNNVDRFNALGIQQIVVPCNGCLKCFKYFYPDLLDKVNFSVRHVLEVIYDRLKQDPSILKKIEKTVTYQDSCRLGRGEGMTEQPRQILDLCGIVVNEFEVNRYEAKCCGAGGGIRSVYRDLSMEMATDMLVKAPSDNVVSACPFCTFNLNYTSRKKGIDKNVAYITSLVLQALE